MRNGARAAGDAGFIGARRRALVSDPAPIRIDLRESTGEDVPFLRRLFVATHPEFGVLPVDLAASILVHQYEVRERQYRARFPTLVDHVIEFDGRPAGHLSIAAIENRTVIVLVDIAVLPDAQHNGLASSVLAQLLADADRRGATIELSVTADNPAVRLYERFGFVPSAHAENAASLRMRRSPA